MARYTSSKVNFLDIRNLNFKNSDLLNPEELSQLSQDNFEIP